MNPTPLPWRIQVYPSGGWRTATPTTLEPGDGVLSLDALNRTPGGGCLDGQITAIPALAGLQPRDEITVEVQNTSTLAWEPIYAGVIMTCGNPRSSSPQAHRLAGIQQRAYEMPYLEDVRLEGDDISIMARLAWPSDTARRPGITVNSTNFPTQTMELGDRAAMYESTGDILDALAATAGAFAVPTGETYTFDGRVYAAGEIVPPTEWGVKPDGAAYFTRPAPAPLEMSEADARTSVEWNPISAEETNEHPVLVYAAALNLEELGFITCFIRDGTNPDWYHTSPPITRPIARVDGLKMHEDAASIGISARTLLDGPQDFMTPASKPNNASGVLVTDFSNATDGNPSTYAVCQSNAGDTTVRSVMTWRWTATRNDGVWKLTYLTPPDLPAGYARMTYGIRPLSGSAYFEYLVDVPLTNGERRTVWIPNLAPQGFTPVAGANPFENATPNLSIFAKEDPAGSPPPTTYLDIVGLRVYEVEYWEPDGETYGTMSRSAIYARTLTRVPTVGVARAATRGLGPITRDLTIHPATGSDVTAAIERITYSLTPADGAMTTYYAGQAWPAAIREQQVMLTRLARRAVAEGGRRR